MNSSERKVPIKNVLYMYSYIWDKVNYKDFINLSNEDDFDSVNILATLFLVNVNGVMKRGLYKEYHEIKEELKGIKGKIDFAESLNKLLLQNAKAFCKYDELSSNNIINQIIKTTAYKLYKSYNINEENKKKINNVLLYFNQVDLIEIKEELFNIKYNKNNSYVAYLINICKLINGSCMLSENKGKYKFINVLDDDTTMEYVYELFVFKFYQYHLKNNPQIISVRRQSPLKWNLNGGNQNLLPAMRMDTLIEGNEKTIIIDTKYKSALQNSQYKDSRIFASDNLYQMYTYMNRINVDNELEGILLYPFKDQDVNETYDVEVINNGNIKNSKLKIITIDLSKKWEEIEENLLSIIKVFS